jgi:thioredoxin 1
MKTAKSISLIITFLIGTVGIITSCTEKTINDGSTKTSLPAVEFNDASVSDKNSVIIDVRTPEEYESGHITNSVNVDYNAPDFGTNAAKISKEKTVYIYCRSGARSARAATMMRAQGYKVIELQGGIIRWEEAGLPVQTGGYVEPSNSGMNQQQFDALLNTSKLVLVDFNAAWCGPCKRMEPFLKQLSKEMSSTLDIVRIDVDDNPDIASSKGIEALPTFHAYRDGRLVWQGVGYMSKEDLQKKLQGL